MASDNPYSYTGGKIPDDLRRTVVEVVVADGVETIGIDAFDRCESLISIQIPDGVEEIGDRAFYGCKSLISIQIPDGLKKIGDYAFSGCYSLSFIQIPDGLEKIGDGAFAWCEKLSSIKIPIGVDTIGNHAFHGCYSLISIQIPGGLEKIGDYAFRGCRKLSSIQLPDGLEKIGDDAFAWCAKLSSIKIPDGLEKIGDDAFNRCEKLSSIQIPDGVEEIGNHAFQGCESLISIQIPDGLKKIGDYAFNDCGQLSSIQIPDGVEEIGNLVFCGCESLSSIQIPDGLKKIGGAAFSGCKSLSSIQIPDGVDTIGNNAFEGCKSLSSIKIPDGLKKIGFSAFRFCRKLSSIQLPDGLEKIGDDAFAYCDRLLIVAIPSGTLIGDDAFLQCRALETASKIEFSADQLKTRFIDLPLHQACYRAKEIDDIPLSKLSSAGRIDRYNLTPLHILASNPNATKKMIELVADKHKIAITKIDNSLSISPLHFASIYRDSHMLEFWVQFAKDNFFEGIDFKQDMIDRICNFISKIPLSLVRILAYAKVDEDETVINRVVPEIKSAFVWRLSGRANGLSDATKNTEDQLDYDTYASALVKVVKTIEESGHANFAVGLMGSWGVGKTKLWQLIKEKIQKDENTVSDFGDFGEPPITKFGMLLPMPRAFVILSFLVDHWSGCSCRYGCSYDSRRQADVLNEDAEERHDRITALILPILFLLPIFQLPIYTKKYHAKAQTKWFFRRATEVWIRLHGYNLNPIKVIKRNRIVSIWVFMRIMLLICFWILCMILRLVVMILMCFYGIFSGSWINPFKAQAITLEHIRAKKHIFVTFHAWVYDGCDVLWAGLMLEMLKEIEKAYPGKYTWFKLQNKIAEGVIQSDESPSDQRKKRKHAFKIRCIWLCFSIVVLIIGIILLFVPYMKETTETTSVKHSTLLGILITSGSVITLGTSVISWFLAYQSVLVNPYEEILKKAMHASGVQSHDYSGNAGFMNTVKEEMQSLCVFLQQQKPIFHKGKYLMPHLSIFVDDLDRCRQKTVMDVLQAITLLLEDEFMSGLGSTVWMAIDPQIVVSAIDQNNNNFLRTAGVDGNDYLDKIIQLPFCIPRMTKKKKIKLMARMVVPNKPTLSDVRTNFKKIKERLDNNADIDDIIKRSQFQDLKKFKETFYPLKGMSDLRDFLKMNVSILDDEVLKKAMETIHDMISLESQLEHYVSIGVADNAVAERLAAAHADNDNDVEGGIGYSSEAGRRNNSGSYIGKDDGNNDRPSNEFRLGTMKKDDENNSGNNYQIERNHRITPSLDEENIFTLDPKEWFWIKSISEHLPQKARKMKKILNIYNVSREISNSKGHNGPIFRRKLIKITVLAEMWPQKIAWILQVAEDALAAEKTEKLNKPWEGGMKLNELVRKVHRLIKGKKDVETEHIEPIQSIFGDIPLAVVYRAIVQPLMHSMPDSKILRRERVDLRAFEYLLKEFDSNLNDELTLSDIYPPDYDKDFDALQLPNPSLIPYMINMNYYYLDDASIDLSKIINRDCVEHVSPETPTNLNIEWVRKSDRKSDL